MQAFQPTEIFIDKNAVDDLTAKRILQYFQSVPVTIIDDTQNYKYPRSITTAKKNLLLTHYNGEIVKQCQGLGDYVCCNYFTISLISNCPMECSYCFLQEYLKNNPTLTIYTNVDKILLQIKNKVTKNPQQIFRIGTGELSDSLALDHVTHFSTILVDFAAKHKNLVIELKTKSSQVENLLGLDHQQRTIVSWSINPQNFIDQEEHKTASLNERLNAARLVADDGYPIAFHLDPLLALENWKKEYKDLVNRLVNELDANEISWISLGSLRFTPGLQKIALKRFPKSQLYWNELYPSADGKIRYFREIREDLYVYVKNLLENAFSKVPNYLCMETKTVWKNVYNHIPKTIDELEGRLAGKFIV